MSPRTKEQFESIRKNRKEAIMETAMKLFAENGFSGVSVSQLAKESGISKGLLYNYFNSKETLLKEIIIEGLNRMILPLSNINPEHITRKDVIGIIDITLESMKTDRRYWQLYVSVISQPKVMTLVNEEFMKIITPFINMVAEYFKDKGVSNPVAYSFLIGSLMDGIAIDYLMAPDEFPLDDIRNLIVEKLL
jgi:AcrR family transcriptional regulator